MVSFFSLLSKAQDTAGRKPGVTQELLTLVTGLAHYLKLLIRICLKGALRTEKERGSSECLYHFLDDLSDLEAEATWTTALARDTQLAVPIPMPARDGRLVITVDDGGPAHHATLMSWLPGQLLGRHLTEPNLFRMGELFAALHAHGLEWERPVDFSQRRFDRILSRGESDEWASVARKAGVAASDIAVIRNVHERVDAAYAALDPADLRVIHGDLHHDNIKVFQGQLCPFDFEDTVLGYRIHDIAMAMLDLWDTVVPDRYDRLLDAFRRGYTHTLDWPAGELVLFQLGRYVWRLNWVARRRPAQIAAAAAATADAFRFAATHGRLEPTIAS